MIVRSAEGIVERAAIATRSLNNTTVNVIQVILGLTVEASIDRRGSIPKGIPRQFISMIGLDIFLFESNGTYQ
jgi:hypothetical protein